MQAGCYERKNGHWSKVFFARGKLWKLPRYGKLSAKNKSAESFPQFPQLRRLGFFPGKEPVSRRRYPSLCCAETYSHAKAHRLPGDRGLAARKQSRQPPKE
jgi:hypothetical protein